MNEEKENRKSRKWVWVGAILGGIWGLFSFIIFPTIADWNILLGIILGMPIFASAVLDDKLHLPIPSDSLMSLFIFPIIIGILIGIVSGLLIDKFKKQ